MGSFLFWGRIICILLSFLLIPHISSADSVTVVVPWSPWYGSGKRLTCDNQKQLDFSSEKTAILIGESQYPGNALTTVSNDMRALYEVLQKNNYNVQCFTDLTGQQLSNLLDEVNTSMFTYKGNFVFYISGHGWNDGSTNFAFGVDANLDYKDPDKLRAASANLDKLVAEASYSLANQIVFLFDVCRDLAGIPKPTNIEANLHKPKDVIIGYSAGFGTPAYSPEAEDKYSAYAGALAAYMDPILGLSVQEILANVQAHVRDMARSGQNPQIPSFVTFASREIFLKRAAAGLKGMRSVDEAVNVLGAKDYVFDDEIPDGPERNAVYPGVSALIRSGVLPLYADPWCRKYYRSLDDELHSHGKLRNIRIYPVHWELIDKHPESSKEYWDKLYMIEFSIASPEGCTSTAHGEEQLCIIGHWKKSNYWDELLCELTQGVKVVEPFQLMFFLAQSLHDVSVTLYDLSVVAAGEKPRVKQSIELPWNLGDTPAELPGTFELLGGVSDECGAHFSQFKCTTDGCGAHLDDQICTAEWAASLLAPSPPPLPPPPPPPKREVLLVLFDGENTKITSHAMQVIQRAANMYKTRRAIQFDITGYDDLTLSPSASQRLSERRANAVAGALQKSGVPRSVLVVTGRGQNDPKVPAKPGVPEPQNGRVEISFWGSLW